MAQPPARRCGHLLDWIRAGARLAIDLHKPDAPARELSPCQTGLSLAGASGLWIDRKPCLRLHSQQLACLGVARRGAAVFAGGDAGQGHELPPAESGPRAGELVADRAVILLGM